MKLINVDHAEFSSLVGQDILPYASQLNVEDYIIEHHQLPLHPFVLVGKLDKNKRSGASLALMPDAYDFQVERIEYLPQGSCP